MPRSAAEKIRVEILAYVEKVNRAPDGLHDTSWAYRLMRAVPRFGPSALERALVDLLEIVIEQGRVVGGSGPINIPDELLARIRNAETKSAK
ncbi:hypothetical protein FHW79_005366 [Azospirillum sp. OGB3]|uniref:hypothetical protein n=1 Tax=Azospirillum sp. OGB3 TaxID=2587012 RepID=UPI001606C289|nr:hypothetical protein [Azospirillum sp. OGB3]MBB3267701.1 hypothetical protein [Azospirillum sp. OGB3]